MDDSQILPISGDHFEDFLLLTEPDHKISKTTRAWQVLQQQTKSHVPGGNTIDLNRISVDVIRMELLVFPVVEDWKRPLTDQEWQNLEEESIQLEDQMSRMRKLSILVRKKDPLAFSDLAPLFNKLFKQNQELRKDWDEFKTAWAGYKQQWKLFQTRKERAQKKEKLNGIQQGKDKKNKEEDEDLKPPVAPPMFLRDRWLALQLGSNAFEVELKQCCKNLQSETGESEDGTEVEAHPGVQFLVKEVRNIYVKTKGFELIEKVQLTQDRNQQIIEELQPFYPEPIISEAMLKDSEPSQKRNESTKKTSQNDNEKKKSHRKLWLVGLLPLLLILGIFMFQRQGAPPKKDEMKHLKFFPKNKTLTAKSQETNTLSETNLNDMLSDFSIGIPAVQSNDRLRKLVTATPEIMENLANSILEDLGKNAVFAFTEAQSYYLFWQGKLQEFASPKELKKALGDLEKEYKKVESFWRGMGDKTPENAKLVPEILNGEPVYALEMLDENGEAMQVYMTEEGVRLRLGNGEFLDKTLTREEAINAISKQ